MSTLRDLPLRSKLIMGHLGAFRQDRKFNNTIGKPNHFWTVVDLLWPEGSPKHFVRHPWAEKMTEEACKNDYLGINGAASVGKTDWGAIWALINWWCAPSDTLVLVTSTSLKESRKRIWGSIKEYYLAVKGEMPGKLVDSMGQIKPDPCAEFPTSDKCGVALIAGEKARESQEIGKLIGIKNQRVIMIADEMPELSETLIKAAHSNLSGCPHFQMIGMGNFKSIYDPFGVFTTPVAGWNSITLEDEEWQTERGKCLRFDGLKSPNILLGEDVWPIYGSKNLREHNKLKPNSLEFWRMCRAFPCPEGAEQAIYSESDLLAGRVHEKTTWQGTKIHLSSLDPAFTTGGDRCAQCFGWLGMSKEGIYTLELEKIVLLVEDARLKDKPRAFQIAQQFKDNCIREGVAPFNAALDASGAGIPFGEICVELWSNQILRVQFGGAASEHIVSETDTRKSKEVYVNRVSEIWYGGLGYVRSNLLLE